MSLLSRLTGNKRLKVALPVCKKHSCQLKDGKDTKGGDILDCPQCRGELKAEFDRKTAELDTKGRERHTDYKASITFYKGRNAQTCKECGAIADPTGSTCPNCHTAFY